jgi:hypothetical protein
MPVSNYDSSDLTRVRRAMALSAFQVKQAAAVNAGTSVQPEQRVYATLDVVTARRQGECYCATAGTYNNNGGCSCNITR